MQVKILLMIILIGCCYLVKGQEMTNNIDALQRVSTKHIPTPDTLKNKLNKRIIKNPPDSIQLDTLQAALDSVKELSQVNASRLYDRRAEKLEMSVDSVKEKMRNDSLQSKVATATILKDSLLEKFNNTVGRVTDSINSLEEVLPAKTQEMENAVNDSINKVVELPNYLDSLESGSKNVTLKSEAESKVKETQKSLENVGIGDESLENMEPDLRSTEITDQLPDLSMSESIPNINTNIPEADRITPQAFGSVDLKIPDVGQQQLMDKLKPDMKLKGVSMDKVGNMDGPLPEMSNFGDEMGQLGDVGKYTDKIKKVDIKGINGVEKVEGVTGSMKEIRKQGNDYAEPIENIRHGDLGDVDSEVNDRLASMEETREFTEQKEQMETWRDSQLDRNGEFEKYKDKKALLESAKENGKKAATGYFGEHQEQLIQAHKRLFELKKKYKSIPSIKNLAIESPVKMGGKTLLERLSGGFILTLGGNEDTNFVDVNPYLGFQISHSIQLHTGYMWRYMTRINKNNFRVARLNIKGPRMNVKYTLFKGFAIVASYERLVKEIEEEELTGKSMYNGIFLGLDKCYNISGQFYGNIQFLYNIVYDNIGPYRRPYNVRFGFFFDPK